MEMEGTNRGEILPSNPPDLVTNGHNSSLLNLELSNSSPSTPTTKDNDDENGESIVITPSTTSPSSPTPISPTLATAPTPTPTILSYSSDQNQNRLLQENGKIDLIKIDMELPPTVVTSNSHPHALNGVGGVASGELGVIFENKIQFQPSSNKDLEVMKNIRKVFISRIDEASCGYKVTNEVGAGGVGGEGLFETVQGETDGGIWSRYFKQQQKVILLKDSYQHGILKLDFGRSRTVSCCQTLRFAAMTSHFKSVDEEPLCIIFKDRGCCIYSCCSSGVTYETVPQTDNVHPFTVKTKRQWKSRAEFMVKHNDGSILAFIDREKKFYTLTMGENLKPTMKITLIGFVIAMDIMDREDAGRLNCYLRPSTYVTILFLLMLFFMIGAFLFHFITAMVLAWPKGANMGCTDSVHAESDDPFLPPTSPNASYPHQHQLQYHSSAEVIPYTFNISSSAQQYI